MIALALSAMGQTIEGPAPPIARPRPATQFACSFAGSDNTPFTLSGVFPEVPAGTDPNAAQPMVIGGTGAPPLNGRVSFTAGSSGQFFRNYQIRATNQADGARYHVNLELRRGGHGVANVTRYVERTPPEPYDFIAVGLCRANFDPTVQGQ